MDSPQGSGSVANGVIVRRSDLEKAKTELHTVVMMIQQGRMPHMQLEFLKQIENQLENLTTSRTGSAVR